MQDQAFHQRIRQLYRMLFELATGNLTFRIHHDAPDDIGKLAEVLNTFAAQMHLAIKKSGYVVPYYTYQHLIHSAVLLDRNFNITGFTNNVPIYFAMTPEEVTGLQIEELLTPESKTLWLNSIRRVVSKHYPATFHHQGKKNEIGILHGVPVDKQGWNHFELPYHIPQ